MKSPVSMFGLALLAAIVEHSGANGVTQEALYEAVPANPRRDAMPGAFDEWPHDIGEWIDELQQLLDAGLVSRRPGKRSFIYAYTDNGGALYLSAVHPHGRCVKRLRRSVA